MLPLRGAVSRPTEAWAVVAEEAAKSAALRRGFVREHGHGRLTEMRSWEEEMSAGEEIMKKRKKMKSLWLRLRLRLKCWADDK